MGEQQQQESVTAAVKEILAEADMAMTTEGMVRKTAAKRAGVEESVPWLKKLVKGLVREFMEVQQEEEPVKEEEAQVAAQEEAQAQVAAEEDEAPSVRPKRVFDEGEDHVVCQLSAKRNVSIQNFRGKTLVSIREYYEKNGKSLPTNKGISLTVDQWDALKNGIPAVKQAIESLQ